MNSELYFPRNGKSFSKTSEVDFEDTVKLLGDIDINVIFKTEINLTKESINDALEESSSGNDKIHLVVVADSFSDPDQEKVQDIIENLGIESKIKKIEAPVKNLDAILEKRRSNEIITPTMPALKVEGGESAEENSEDKNENKAVELLPENAEEKEEKIITAFIAEYNDILVVFLPDEESAGENFNTILYSVAKRLLRPKKKPKLWKRFIPCSGDSPFDVIRKVILMLAICTFIVSSCMLVNLLVIRPAINDSQNNAIRDMLVVEDEYDDSGNKIVKKPTDGSEGTLVDFSKLLKENDDTIGWIKVPDTKIDYVVCQPPEGKDHEYYLYRDFYKNYDVYGTVFLDYRSQLDSRNLILHGHNMRDGRMFGTLKYYEDFNFYKKHPTFTFNTIYEKSEWKIISILKTNTLESQGEFFNYLRGDFSNDYDFLNFIYQIRERSIIDTPVTANENDTLVTLSTCTYDMSEFRFVVVARKVRDGESSKVDVSGAKENPDTLYPDAWYRTFGGTKPDVTTFQDSYNKKKITWYDGKKKNWSEKDDEVLYRDLEDGKKNAIKEMKNFVARNNYEEEEKKQVDKLVKDYTKLINDAKSRTEINDIYDKAIEDIRKVKTIEDKNSELEESNRAVSEMELKEKKDSAKLEINNSIAGNTYRTTQLIQVNRFIEVYSAKIDQAETVEDVDLLTDEAIKRLKSVKTEEQLLKEEQSSKALQSSKQASDAKKRTEEASKKAAEASRKAAEVEASRKASELEASRKAAAELNSYRSSAINRIRNHVNINDYKYAQQQEINSIINRYTNMINTASDKATIDSYVSSAINELNNVKTAAQIDQESKQSSVDSSYDEPIPVDSDPDNSEPDEPQVP